MHTRGKTQLSFCCNFRGSKEIPVRQCTLIHPLRKAPSSFSSHPIDWSDSLIGQSLSQTLSMEKSQPKQGNLNESSSASAALGGWTLLRINLITLDFVALCKIKATGNHRHTSQPFGPSGGGRHRSTIQRLMRPFPMMQRSHFLLVLLCYDRHGGLIHKHTHPSFPTITSASDLLPKRSSSHFSESYIWAWEVFAVWSIQGSAQQLVPQDRDEVLGHDLLLLL